MILPVDVIFAGTDRPPPGASVIVQLRDTSLADAPAVVLSEAREVVSGRGDELAHVELELEPSGRRSALTVWALVDVDADGRTSRGDYVTTQAFEVPVDVRGALRVSVKRV